MWYDRFLHYWNLYPSSIRWSAAPTHVHHLKNYLSNCKSHKITIWDLVHPSLSALASGLTWSMTYQQHLLGHSWTKDRISMATNLAGVVLCIKRTFHGKGGSVSDLDFQAGLGWLITTRGGNAHYHWTISEEGQFPDENQLALNQHFLVCKFSSDDK